MATKYWTGRAASVAQVTKVVFSSIVSTETYTVTINGKSVTVTATSTSLADLVELLINAWGSSVEPEHQEMVAAERLDPTLSGLQLTAVNPGVPITVSASASTGTATVTEPTAASGPNFWDVAANWDGAALPSASDTLIIRDTDVSILYGLTDTNNYTQIDIEASFTGSIGLPVTNDNGYPEYRTRFLTLGSGSAITINIGYGNDRYPERVYLDVVGSNATITVFGSRGSQDGTYPIQIKDTASSTTARVYGGAVMFDGDSSATVTTLDVIDQTGGQQTPDVRTTSLVTVTTATFYGGTGRIEGSGTTLVVRDNAEVTNGKASAFATVRVGQRGRLHWESSGGITTKLHCESDGVVDFGRVATTKTVAACDLYAGGTILDPLDKITWTAGVVLVGCRLADVTLDLGFGVTIA